MGYWEDRDKIRNRKEETQPQGSIDPGFITQAKAGFADTPQAKLKAYAAGMEQPAERFKVRGNDVMYRGKDGTAQRVEPGFLGGLMGKSTTIGGGIAGAARGAPYGWPGMVVGGGLGAALGEGTRQVAGNMAYDDPVSISDIGTEALWEAVPTGVLGKLSQVRHSKGLAKDVAKLDRPAADALLESGRKLGVDLTPGEATNLSSQINKQRLLRRMPSAEDKLRDFFGNRANQVQSALDDYLESVSRVKEVSTGNQRAIDTAKRWFDEAKASRTREVEDLYNQAYSSGARANSMPVVQQVQKKLDKVPPSSSLGRTLKSVYKDMFEDAATDEGVKRVAVTDIEKLDNVKRLLLDPAIEKAVKNGDSAAARELQQVKTSLVDTLGEASPAYKEALQTFSNLSKPINEAENTLLGNLTRMKDTSAMRAARNVFSSNSSSPEAVAITRRYFNEIDPEAWNGMVRAYMQDTFERKLKDFASDQAQQNIGGRVYRELAGSKRQKEIMKAAMSPQQYSAFDELMNVLEATGRASAGASDTATFQAGQDVMSKGKGGVNLGSIFRGSGVALSPHRWADAVDEHRLSKNAAAMADIITDPNGINRMREISMLPPTAKEGALTSLMAEVATRPAERAMESQQPRMIDAIRYNQ